MQDKCGFTLIELSIVLVIIGLIVGGILTGQDLIRTAMLNSIISQKTHYNVAVNTFRGKYGYLPGDSPTAVQMWGSWQGNATDNYTATCYGNNGGTTTTETCNGNNDGLICNGDRYWYAMCDEAILVWNHLASAGMIEGHYWPYRSNGGPYERIGLNIPISKAQPNAGFSLFYLCPYTDLGGQYYANYCRHTFFYGGQDTAADDNWVGMAVYPVLTSLDAYRIDKKMDDGKPATGIVTTMVPLSLGNPTCPSTNVASTAIYDLTVTGPSCALMFAAEGF